MVIKTTQDVWESTLNRTQVSVALAILHFKTKDVAFIAHKVSLSVRVVRRTIKEIGDQGFSFEGVDNGG